MIWIWNSRTHQFIIGKALPKCSRTFLSMVYLHLGPYIVTPLMECYEGIIKLGNNVIGAKIIMTFRS